MAYITKKKHNKTIKKKIRKTIKKYGKLTKNKNKNKKHYTKRIIRNKKSIIQKGGDTPKTSIIKDINFFSESDKKEYTDIEEFLNPIYGVIMCETGYITNNYWLGKKRSDEKNESITNEMNFVYKTSRLVIPNIQPTIDIMKYVNAYDIGNYIALLYFYNKTQNGVIFNKLYKDFKVRKDQEKDNEEKEEKENEKILIKEKVNNKNNFNRAFGIIASHFKVEQKDNKPFSKEMFHILLYCLWWVSNNMDGIKNYYKGINDTFKIINQDDSIKVKFPIISIIQDETADVVNESFETIVGKNIISPIKNINYEYAQNFCDEKVKRYPDCVETTVRNFINLLCFNGVHFDTTKLQEHLKNVNQKTIEYYKKYYNYDLQMLLEARDEWSHLVIYHANDKLRFNNTCEDKNGKSIGYNIKSGVKTTDGTNSNFFQLLQNLLSEDIKIDTWKKQLSIINPLLTVGDEDDMDNETMKTGIGKFTIIYTTFIITFVFVLGHSYIKIKNIKNENIMYDHLNTTQQQYMSYLLMDKNYNNDKQYLWIKYTSELLEKKYNNNNSYHFLELLSSELINTDTRNRIYINPIKLPEFYKYIKNNENDFAYISNDFKFVDKIPNLRMLYHSFLNKNIKEMPDMSPLKNIETIGHEFANDCKSVTNIDLSGITNLKTIGHEFANKCERLTNINLSGLTKLETIRHKFANKCERLTNIDLSGLTKLETIGHEFANDCKSLTNIDLSGLTKLETIGQEFANDCKSLTNIDLSGLINLKSIGHGFANHCNSLTNIVLSGLTKLEKIGNGFAHDCNSLTNIVLSGLINLKSIGANFASSCKNLTTINLIGLTKLKIIGANFANKCDSLREIIISKDSASHLRSIIKKYVNNEIIKEGKWYIPDDSVSEGELS